MNKSRIRVRVRERKRNEDGKSKSRLGDKRKDTSKDMFHNYLQKVYGEAAMKRYEPIMNNDKKFDPQ